MATLRDSKVHKATGELFWRKDGTPVPIEFTSAPLVMQSEHELNEEEGRQAGAVIIFRDVSSRLQTERTLRELGSIVQNSNDAIIGLALDGRITRWNRAASKIYGYSEMEILGQSIEKIIPDDAPNDVPQMLAQIKNRQTVEPYETTRRRQDGTLVRVVVSLSPILDEQGDVIGASSISREVFRDRIAKASATSPTPDAAPTPTTP
jgi:PAS domain S-box-containing protein